MMIASRWTKILLVISLLLLLIRLAMPYAILRYIEYRFDKIPEYKIHIDDLDLHLYRGAYVLKGIRLINITKQIPVPFFSAERIDLAVQWRALFHRRLVAEMKIESPELNFVIDPKGEQQQLTIDQEWQNAVKALFPLNFNNIIVRDGRLSFQSFTSRPPFKLFLKQVNGKLVNLQNAERLNKHMVSSLAIDAKGMDDSPVVFRMEFDPFAKQPTFDLDAEIKRMNIPEANNFLRHYTKIKVKKGLFSLYVEAAAARGKITGYAKPIIEHLEVVEVKEDDSVIEALYKSGVQLLSKILENPEKKSVATKIAIKGDIEDPDTSIWSIVSNLLHHAFIQALIPKIDNSIDMRDVEL